MIKFIVKTLEYWLQMLAGWYEHYKSFIYAVILVTVMILILNGAV
jgi:hypothetical protein